MRRFLKSLLWVATTLGLGALAYALMRAEGERGLRPASRERGEEPLPRPKPAPRPVAVSEPAQPAPRAAAAKGKPPRCAALKKDGERCAREPLAGSEYCWQHQ
jgi:hypothetical protein